MASKPRAITKEFRACLASAAVATSLPRPFTNTSSYVGFAAICFTARRKWATTEQPIVLAVAVSLVCRRQKWPFEIDVAQKVEPMQIVTTYPSLAQDASAGAPLKMTAQLTRP